MEIKCLVEFFKYFWLLYYLYVWFLLVDEKEFPFIIADGIGPCYPDDDWFLGCTALELEFF